MPNVTRSYARSRVKTSLKRVHDFNGQSRESDEEGMEWNLMGRYMVDRFD